MATKKGGAPGNLQPTTPVTVSFPDSALTYMTWLARHSMWGPTVQDVILKMISPQLHALFESGYHNKRLPESGSIEQPPTGRDAQSPELTERSS